ncbi:hypothetical protein Ddye_008581 [Dipteronia dyeriana]|uniref:Uncharacterized protein n=1 Tax=Dipteronia dyeriana TaxID=168575 RepID=A0AAD9X9Z1_9ROSI|nr:hypothetical protein Ddye_008581 [Dipteronia dyeriana]
MQEVSKVKADAVAYAMKANVGGRSTGRPRKRRIPSVGEEQNGGDFLSQQLSGPDETGDAETIFPSNELEKATKNFDEETIIGRGRNGPVYKTILKDNNPVAIKKSMKVGQSQTK